MIIQKFYVRLVRLLLRQLELDSWTEADVWLLPQGKVCLILCTWCLWCVWRKLTIIRQRLFFEALGITVISNQKQNNSITKLKVELFKDFHS